MVLESIWRNGDPANGAANGNVVVGPSTLWINSAVKTDFSLIQIRLPSDKYRYSLEKLLIYEIHNLLVKSFAIRSSNNKTLEVSV
jgi:hypothetical protein